MCNGQRKDLSMKKLQLKQPKRRLIGRPKEAVPEAMVEQILNCIANGESLRSWCRGGKDRPTFTTVYEWLRKDEQFSARFKESRKVGFDAIAEECQIIASEPPSDQLALGWKKLQIDTHLRLLGKWDPARYGDRQAVAHEGGITLTVTTGVPPTT